MVDTRHLRTALAVDAVATVAAGLAAASRPDLLTALVPTGRLPLDPETGTVRRLGLAVAAFGAGKGLLYAVALRRHRDGD